MQVPCYIVCVCVCYDTVLIPPLVLLADVRYEHCAAELSAKLVG
jgi:hypothetical protein